MKFGGADSEAIAQDCFETAAEQLWRISEDYYGNRFALLFCCLSVRALPKGPLLPLAQHQLERILKIRANAAAWCIPTGFHGPPRIPTPRRSTYHPGVALLLRSCPKPG